MINHVSIGVRDLAKAKRFYDAVLKPLGYACQSESEGSLGYGSKAGIPFWVNTADHPVKADLKSGLHFCFDAESRKAVDAFHAGGLKAGGKDNGQPGIREAYSPTYYAAFLVDPDGYRVEAYCSKKG